VWAPAAERPGVSDRSTGSEQAARACSPDSRYRGAGRPADMRVLQRLAGRIERTADARRSSSSGPRGGALAVHSAIRCPCASGRLPSAGHRANIGLRWRRSFSTDGSCHRFFFVCHSVQARSVVLRSQACTFGRRARRGRCARRRSVQLVSERTQ